VVHLQAAADHRPEPRLWLGPRLPFYAEVVEELYSFSAETTDTGHVRYEASRLQAHDDLLFALGLSVWWGEVMGDGNWSCNIDVSRALDGTLIRKRLTPGSTRRTFAEDRPPDEPFAQSDWDELKQQGPDGLGPLRP
jgi:hypothetical protein